MLCEMRVRAVGEVVIVCVGVARVLHASYQIDGLKCDGAHGGARPPAFPSSLAQKD